MMRKVFFGLVWCFVLDILAQVVTGGIAGGLSGARGPRPGSAAEAARRGAEAGERAVEDLREYLVGGSVFLAVLGTAAGFLPGTRPKEARPAA